MVRFSLRLAIWCGQGTSFQFFQVAVGDLNGDQKLDFVVSDYDDNYVSVFIGNGDGTFKPGVTYAVGTNPTDVAVADLNRDGKLDLAVANQNCTSGGPPCGQGTVSVLLGNGNGTFQPHVDFDTGQDPNWVTVGDFNRDGKLDLAVIDGQGNQFTSAVVILLGKGDGTFQLAGSYPLNTNAASGVTADLNGDGKLDIAVVDNIGLVSILLGKGDGTFRPRVDYPVGSFPWGHLDVGDFTENGHVDLALVNGGSNSMSVLLGNGDGTFQPEIEVSTGSSPHGLVAGDFNRDGRLDFAVANLGDNTVSILLQDGTIALNPPNLNFGLQVTGSTKKVTLTNVGTTPVTISSIGVSGTNATDFTQSNNCGSSLGAGAHCTISVTFTPSQLGLRTAAITVTDSAPGSPQSVALSGIGVISGPDATLSATALTFATQLVGTTSQAQSVTLSDYGTVALNITSIGFTGSNPGDFVQTNTCGSSVAPGASCTISVSFKPTGINTRTASVSIIDSVPGSPQTVLLSGTGTVVELNPASLSFGVVKVGNSKNLATTLTNLGSTTLGINSITITGTDSDEFSQTNTCHSSVGAGKSCLISVTFGPSEKGSDRADLLISDNGGGSPQQVLLEGAGCVVGYHRKCLPALTSSPAVQSALSAKGTAAVPSPTGPSPVGTRIMDLNDATRDDPFLPSRAKRELLVRFWYPASVDQGCKLAEYTSPRVWNYFSELTRLPLPRVTTISCLDAPVANGEHPVVVFTHGYTGTFTDYTFLFEDLASRGYVVASIDHTYEATAVEFPDGRFVKSVVGSHLANTWRMDDQSLSVALSVRLDDLRFVLNELEHLDTSTDNPFAGKLNMTNVALAGHSLGGLTTWQGVQQDTRFKAGILLDPYLFNVLSEPTQTPVMLLTMGHEQRSEDECRLWSDLLGPRFSVNLHGAEHVTPSDAVWLAKGAITAGTMGPDKAIAARYEITWRRFSTRTFGESSQLAF
jgi:dienelactone hydrolase